MKRFAITGAYGFLGRYLLDASQDKDVVTIGKSASYDVSWDISTAYLGDSISVDVVIHAAGYAHVYPKTEEEKAKFYAINFEGTKNLINALDSSRLKQFVLISTVAVYGVEKGEGISEDDPVCPVTPYGISKRKAEEYVLDWGQKHNVNVLVLRLPLIVGDNAPGNLGKMIESIRKGRYLSINQGKAKRSAVLAEDVAQFIMNSSEYKGIYNLTDNYDPRFSDFEERICEQLGKSRILSIPLPIARLIGFFGNFIPGFPVNSTFVDKMSLHFTVSCEKAMKELGWKPRPVIPHINLDK